MKSYFDFESQCELVFRQSGDCWHIWTPEDFEIIFTCENDFKAGMNIIGLCAKLFPDIKLFTYEIMSNHLHFVAAGEESIVQCFLVNVIDYLSRYLKAGQRSLDTARFNPSKRKLETLEQVRNAIAYNNRNGFVVHPDHTPFTYPWGANRYYYNPDAKQLASQGSTQVSLRERRRILHSRMADDVSGLTFFNGYACPLSFCDIESGERIFHNASNYFSRVSKNVERYREIAKELGEKIFYNDDELYSLVSQISMKKYSCTPSLMPPEAKIELAKSLHFDYNSSIKQISRMLKLNINIVESICNSR